jgi:hypothetical protein
MDPHDFHAKHTAFVRRHQELCRAHTRMLAVNGALPVDMLLGWDCVLLENDGDGLETVQLELRNVEGAGFSAVAVVDSGDGEEIRTQRDGGAVARSVHGGGIDDTAKEGERQGGGKEGSSEAGVGAPAVGGTKTEPSKEVSRERKKRGSAR